MTNKTEDHEAAKNSAKKADNSKNSQTPTIAHEHKKTKLVVAVLLVIALVVSVVYIKSLDNNTQATLKTYRLESNNKDYRDSFSAQDTVIIDLSFRHGNTKNYRVEIAKDGSSSAPFRIEIPAVEEGKTRTVAIPKQLLSAGTVTLTLKDAANGKTLEEKKINITN